MHAPRQADFTAYQLRIHSELELPELLPASPSAAADVCIRRGDLAPLFPDAGSEGQASVNGHAGAVLLQVPGYFRCLVEQGSRITIDAAPGVDEDTVRLFVLGSALGTLLFQRGYLVLHGNAIRIGDACMICVGRSGAGKSTLAAGFMQRGFGILADDVVPIDDHCRALPGFPRIKLWQDAADRVGIVTDGLQRIRPALSKFNVPLRDAFVTQPLPVRWIYVLESSDSTECSAEPVLGMHCFPHLLEHTYRNEYLPSLQLQADHLRLCGQLASRVHVRRVRRPAQGFALDGLIDFLLADMAALA